MTRTYTNKDVFHPRLSAQAVAAGFPIRACVNDGLGFPTKNFKDKRSAWEWIKETGRFLNNGKGVTADDLGKKFWVECD